MWFKLWGPKGDSFEWLGFICVVKNEESGLRPSPPKVANPLIWLGGGAVVRILVGCHYMEG